MQERAKLTIEVLVDNLVPPEIVNKVFLQFYREISLKNAIKLLLRGKKLHEARAEATKILKLVIEVDQAARSHSLVWRLLQEDKKKKISTQAYEVLNNLLQLISKTLTTITCFQTENTNYKREFTF